MAYIKKTGKTFCVKQGNTGKILGRYKTRKAANVKLSALHKKNNPKSSNRGSVAQKRNS